MRYLKIGLVLIIIFTVATIAIVNINTTRQSNNESRALNRIRQIRAAEETYQATKGAGKLATLDQLIERGLVDKAVKDTAGGYTYSLTLHGDYEYELTASPIHSESYWRGGNKWYSADRGSIKEKTYMYGVAVEKEVR